MFLKAHLAHILHGEHNPSRIREEDPWAPHATRIAALRAQLGTTEARDRFQQFLSILNMFYRKIVSTPASVCRPSPLLHLNAVIKIFIMQFFFQLIFGKRASPLLSSARSEQRRHFVITPPCLWPGPTAFSLRSARQPL